MIGYIVLLILIAVIPILFIERIEDFFANIRARTRKRKSDRIKRRAKELEKDFPQIKDIRTPMEPKLMAKFFKLNKQEQVDFLLEFDKESRQQFERLKADTDDSIRF